MSLIVLVALTFLLLKILPGGPFDDEKNLNPIVKERMIQHWQVDQTWSSQVISYLGALAHGDLGVSMVRPDREVVDVISVGLKNTIVLNSMALALIAVGAFLISLVAVYYRNTSIELLIDQTVLTFLALPSLFWGPLLIYIFGFSPYLITKYLALSQTS